MPLIPLIKAGAALLARPLAKVGFDGAVGATQRVSDLATGAALREVARDQLVDLTTDAGAHSAAKASTHVAGKVGAPLVSRAWALVAARVPHVANAARFGVQAGVATSARDQVTGDETQLTSAMLSWADSVWAPYVVVAAAVGFSIAFGKLSGLNESKWGVALVTAISSFIGDALLSARDPGWVWQALLASAFGAALSVVVSLTPLGRRLEDTSRRKRQERTAAAH